MTKAKRKERRLGETNRKKSENRRGRKKIEREREIERKMHGRTKLKEAPSVKEMTLDC